MIALFAAEETAIASAAQAERDYEERTASADTEKVDPIPSSTQETDDSPSENEKS